MDAKDRLPSNEQTLPVLSRSAWPVTDPILQGHYAVPAQASEVLTKAEITSGTTPQPSQPSQPTSAGRNAPSKVRKPRKTNNASAGKSTLFWVHSDQKSAAEGTKEETLKRIRSHVMSEHNRKKRRDNTKRYKHQTWQQPDSQPPVKTAGSALPPATSSSSHQSPAIENVPIKQEFVSTSAVDYPVAPGPTWGGSDFYGTVAYPAKSSPSAWSYVGQGAGDPFNTGHTQLTERMMRHLHSFLWDLTQQAHPLQTRYNPKLQAHWSSLVQRDPAILHAAICMVTSNAAMRAGELPVTDPTKQRSVLVLDTFHHRGRLFGWSTNIASGNPDYLKIHLAGLRQMIALRNSFADVPSDVRFQISWTDIRVACMAHAKPIFPFVRDVRPAGLSLLPPNDDVALLATRMFPFIKIPGIFGAAMSQLIYDLLELTWYAEWIKGNTGHQQFNEDTEEYFNTEVLYVEYSLHMDRYTATGQVKGDASIEGCCRLACLLFHNSAIWNFYPQIAPLLPKPILALRAALEMTIPSGLFALCRDLLIWLLFVGAACSAALPQERAFFVAELAAAARLQGVGSWQETRTILMGFFYVDRVHLPMIRQIWKEVQLQLDPPV
ncbi:hypothetical protein NUU61_005183 [Penicillium alfredii]|uniref:Uncharacterized protein n=1 Tax=Penicillium alfredii TaxID=1506179 RepID=A0A9W9F9C7_9EURO|nr:uncharacterized protein NUU61_005183 [Penicillium alfredii]KAJ5095827.1 hypothetical protein NUU61_005183 [Penicillium alfredii]